MLLLVLSVLLPRFSRRRNWLLLLRLTLNATQIQHLRHAWSRRRCGQLAHRDCVRRVAIQALALGTIGKVVQLAWPRLRRRQRCRIWRRGRRDCRRR